jgi:hypothetical protein
MKLFNTIILALAIMACSCEPALEDDFEVFTIPKDEHYSRQRHVESMQTTSLFFKAKFDETAVYTLDDGFQDSKNKLLGFSDCNSAHHENSARFAWQWYNNTIEIFAYCYVNGQRIEKFLGSVSPGEVANYEIHLSASGYTFIFKNQKTTIQRKNQCEVGLYLLLWPYFGGQKPAPHDVNIYLKRF